MEIGRKRMDSFLLVAQLSPVMLSSRMLLQQEGGTVVKSVLS